MELGALNDISLSAMNAASNPIGQAIGLVVLDKQLEVTDALSADMIKAMETSVNPSVGSNFDMYV